MYTKPLEWIPDEEADLLMTYKNMNLEEGFHNNYKELSHRMQHMGWERNNRKKYTMLPTPLIMLP